MHGGSVEARSDGPGKGSEFVVRLPVAVRRRAQEPRATGRGRAGQSPVPARRILVVDDNRDAADSLAMLLQIMGHEVRTAYDGLEAVEAAEAFRPDVVLLDIGMPKLNGYEACRRIREQPWGQGDGPRRPDRLGPGGGPAPRQEAGFDHHLVKPVDPAALMKLLASLSAEHGGQLINAETDRGRHHGFAGQYALLVPAYMRDG